jgi:Na+-driven multidrug efflux pump
VADNWPWWLALAAALSLLAAPVLVVIRRAGTDPIPVFRWAAEIRPPWWTHTLSLLGIPLLFVAARELGDGDDSHWLYLVAGALGSLLLQVILIQRHNRRSAASATAP